jgi:hypothetical protein
MGKGGGSQQPTTSQVNQSNLPEYARPYFEDLMQRGQTASQVQYQPYGGERTAGFTPMQEQGFQGVQNLGPSSLNAPAAGLTGVAGLGGLGAGQNYAQQATSPGSMQAYMSPYMQNVVDFQKTQAVNDYGRQLPGQQAAASRAGAFGGSRQAIVESEAQRNLQNTLGGIQAQGSQQAFEQANKNLQFGSQLGLQGLGLAGQMGQQLGQLGQTAFGQEAAAAQAQQAAGATQQAQSQDILNKRYEDFMQQQTFPQSQLQNYSALLRGVPVSPNQTMYQYQAPASGISQLAGLGMGAYGMSQAFKKDGGVVQGYAEGGPTGGIAGGPEGQPTTLEVSKIKTALLKGADPRSFPPSIALLLAISDPRVKDAIDTREGAKVQAALDQGRQNAQLPSIMEEQMAQLGPSGGIAGLDMGAMETAEYDGGGIIAFAEAGSVDINALATELDEARAQLRTMRPAGTAALQRDPAALGTYRQAQQRVRDLESQWTRTVEPHVPGAGMGGAGALGRANPQKLQFDVPAPAGILTALPKTAAAPAVSDAAQNQRELNRLPPPVTQQAPGTQQAPAARAPAAPATTATAPVTSEAGAGMIPLQDVDKKEREYRDYMGKKYSSELKTRLDEVKEQTASAVKERDADRWMAVAMGGFSMAANAKPGARGLSGFLGDLGAGLQLTTKELVGVNKEFRKGQALRTAAEREERKADRLEQMGLDDKAYQVRLKAEKFNLDAQKANQSLTATLAQTDAYKKVNMERIGSERDTRAVILSGRAADKATAEKAKKDAGILGQQKYVEKQLEPYNTRLAELELLIAQGAFEVKVPGGKTMPIAELITRVKAQRKTKRDEVLSERGMSGPGGSLTPGAGGVLQYTPPS